MSDKLALGIALGLDTPARLAALHQTGLLDTAPEPAFDRLTMLSARLVAAPIALVTLVDDTRQFFKSAIGLPEPVASTRETPLSHSLCRYVVASNAPLIVSDVTLDPGLHDHPAIRELGIVAYAGVPLVTSGGQVIGSCCVADTVPHAWTANDLASLTEVAASVMTEIERRDELGQRERAEAHFQVVFDAHPAPMWVFDADTLRFLAVNDAAVATYGYAREEFLAMGILDIQPAEDVAVTRAAIAAIAAGVAGSAPLHGTLRHRRKDGSVMDVDIATHALDGAGHPSTMVLAYDVTAQAAAAAALAASNARERQLLQSLPIIVYRIGADPPYAPIDVSARVADLGYTPEEWLAQPDMWASVLHPDDHARARHAITTALRAHEAIQIEYRVFARDGSMRWMHDEGGMIYDDAGRAIAWQGLMVDITDRKRLEAEIIHQAQYDEVTGLVNRTVFRARVDEALMHAGHHPERVAVLFLDLDDFKTVNDRLGHAAGDRLLAMAAARLVHVAQRHDTVARLGGDQFAILLEAAGSDADLTAVGERILTRMRSPFPFDGTAAHLGASLGIARAGTRTRVDDLVRNAELAMHHAKERGKGRAEAFSPALYANTVDRLALAGDFLRALERREFTLVYQPIVALETGRVVALEALARWHHPERGLIAPAEFIGLAEAMGAIGALGRWVLTDACQEAAQWPVEAGGTAPGVTVNVSVRQLQDPHFVDEAHVILASTGLAPGRLVIEVTESVVAQEPEVTLECLRALRGLGVQIAVDDFGTGYSSLAYLQRLPIDVLKLDKAFVEHVARGGTHLGIVRAIVALGDTLGLRTVAEGIEHEEQRAALLDLGCRFGQGYLFARPMSATRVTAMLQS